MSKQYTPINKGNYTMEPPEREQRVQKILASGWEEAYWDYRRQWEDNPREKRVREYPLLADLELSTVCNLRCPMCYTITDDFKKRVRGGFMDMALFTRIVEEIAGHVPAVRLSLRGEPTLHPHIIDCIRRCKQNGIGEVSFLTNGSTLTEPFIRSLIEAGLGWITVSIDGTGETYERIRSPLKFQETLEKIKLFHHIKKQLETERPIIKVQSVWSAIRGRAEAFYNTFLPYADWIAFNPLIDYLEHDTDISYVDNFCCPQVYQRLVISANGDALMCSNDERQECVVGDCNSQSIYAIWHGEILKKMRETHAKQDGFREISKCRFCYLPRATEDNEREWVNGRELVIQNYINRPQEIGQ